MRQAGLDGPLATSLPQAIDHPEEIAKAVPFLASDEANLVNGVEVFANGGQAQI